MEEKKIEENFLLLIDGSSLLSTQFYGNLPREIMYAKTVEEKKKYFHKIMMTSSGVYTNAVFGFMRTLIPILKEQKPKYLAVAWDLSRNTFRRELYPEYKGNRSELLLPLKEQFVLCQKVLERMGIVQLMDDRYEADDFCGTISKKFEKEIPIRILTKDNDYLQLVTSQTNLWMMHSSAEKTDELFKKYGIDKMKAGVPERVFNFTPELVEQEFGIKPEHVNSLKGLQGDTSDNIKGVPGVGSQTAVKLIQEYGTVENLYASIEHLDKEQEKQIKQYWKEKLDLKRSPLPYLLKTSDTELVGKEAAVLSEKLATIKCDIELPNVTLESLKTQLNLDETRRVFDELEFATLKRELDTGFGEVKVELPTDFRLIDDYLEAEKYIAKIKNQDTIALELVGNRSELIGLAIGEKEKSAVLIPVQFFITEDTVVDWAKKLCESCRRVYVFDLKKMLPWLGEVEYPSLADACLAAYLINPLHSNYVWTEVVEDFLKEHVSDEKALFGKVELSTMWQLEPEKVKDYACGQVACAWMVGSLLESKLEEMEMTELFYQMEMPLIYCLYRMEKYGVKVEDEALREYGKYLMEKLMQLEQEIYELTGVTFNINSPKQLGEVLFDKLKMPYGKKTKTGYSTSAAVLEKLAVDYPVVQKILDYRQLAKLKSTYADGLREFIQSDGRIHGNFNQMITATGRISSTEPNLQNIPIRMEMGREIRKAFVPQEGYVFVDADYSQIELRIMAHMSKDQSLIEAYQNAQDIHAITASQVFHVPLEQVSSQLRRNAKAVNFGIIYGLSAFGLSEGLSISRKEALEYIERYFKTYPGVKRFLDESVQSGHENGYVKTLYGRRRPIPELKSANYMQRSFGERIAMNSPIQGTAADIMKIAMIRVDRRLKSEGLYSRVVIQIHDELLVEALKSEVEQVKIILREEMQRAATLSVPLEIGIEEGMSWYETK
ncbi:MAG: DNA polymerase I [Lachnospiraceae bacterium]